MVNPKEVSGQPATLVVGAGPGVGFEVARRFGQAGHQVALVRRNAQALAKTVERLREEGISAFGYAADATDPQALKSAIEASIEHSGRLDVLHYCVPGPLRRSYGPTTEITHELITENLNARVVGAVVSVAAALPSLREARGALLFTSGISDQTPYPLTAAIGVPQAALRLYALHLHNELADDGVFVGYLPLANPPRYDDPAQEAARTDLPDGFNLTDRLLAADVAEAHFELTRRRDMFERVLGVDDGRATSSPGR
ncbi:SDR family NAD(P)-dependent oxidoreductase [Mycobacteroides abscessus]|uniref:SDR family NAD(P)-dependent oxidoreductase n=1 Tax=Mycobacteroides abscessus TaxID=36809 RepID=UPI0018967897